MNLNKVFLIGNLTRDPELRALPSGASVASFGLATNRVWKDQQGQRQEDVQFHNIVVFGRQAEIVQQYLTKGKSALVEGRIQTRNWDAPDGTKRNRTEIIAERIQFGPKGTSQGGFNQSPKSGFNKQPGEQEGADSPLKEDLPEINIDEGNIKAEDLPF